ncbi:MAG: cobyrinate a,c-diamide synthase [Alphaproteobacteria bacterium]|nr:MAG: cobyrinate a,c-diamide synthase [Alphaproteobacteria bacterium]
MSVGLIIAAPTSGAGKTTVTLGLLAALRATGAAVRGAKSGPDYIDPRFHEAATGAPCPNLDAWAMQPDRIRALAADGEGLLVVEGAMGLFDGAPPDGRGATADLARILGIPVVLVVDCAAMAQSVAPLVRGFAEFDPMVKIVGVILNRVGTPRHEAMLRRAMRATHIPVLGAIPRAAEVALPSRHLGLVQAAEQEDIRAFLDRVGGLVGAHVDLGALASVAHPIPFAVTGPRISPPAQRIAIARDEAFAFTYPHMLNDWRQAGAEISFFSPLADEAPDPAAEFVVLPGGYPELHAGRIAGATTFRAGMARAAQEALIYGECGGYMVLGQGLVDATGARHPMLGLLNLETSFRDRRLHLGYRRLTPKGGPFAGTLLGHEFHYATTVRARGEPLFAAEDAEGNALPDMGLREGRVAGSFAHVIDGEIRRRTRKAA